MHDVKKILLTVLLVLGVMANLAMTNNQEVAVRIGWDRSCEVSVAGYKVYYGMFTNGPQEPLGVRWVSNYCSGEYLEITYSTDFTKVVDAGDATSCLITNLLESSTYFFAGTTYDAYGVESDFSSQVQYTTPKAWDGSPPQLVFGVGSYSTNYVLTTISNRISGITYQTNMALLTPRTFEVKFADYIPTNWTVQSSTNLIDWINCKSGENSTVQMSITNDGGNCFFRLKI